MTFEENRVLFGHDPLERIVAVELFSPNEVTVFRRDEEGRTVSEVAEFRPFFWADSGIGVEGVEQRRLAGELAFGYRVECADWKQFSKLRAGLKDTGVKTFGLNDPVQQYLVQSGRTLFKGMQYEELRRLQISTEGFPEGDARAGDEGADYRDDRIAAIALSDNGGWEEMLFIDPADPEGSEEAALARLGKIIEERDPDILEGHDLFRRILPLIAGRAGKRRVKLGWGRDGSVLTSRFSRLVVAEKTINYPKYEVYGRHLVDTALLAQFYDVSARELEGYGLAEVTEHFHIRGSSGTQGEAGAEPRWKAGEDQGRVRRLYLDDPGLFAEVMGERARQTRELAALLSGSYFIQARIFPYSFQDVTVRGNATKIDALLLREYYRQEHSIPDLPVSRSFEGGYTDIFFTGVARGVWHCDVASLYPSIMLQFDCFPAQDRLGIFRGLLKDLRQFRLEAKARSRELASGERQAFNYHQALQTTFKILINSFYGYLGFGQAHFADFDAASRVTETGRGILKKMVEWLRGEGAEVIEIDTDGIYFVPPNGKAIVELQRGLEKVLPEGLEVEFDAHYPAMFSYKAKNYALLTEEGEVLVTGGALKSRGLEKFQRVFPGGDDPAADGGEGG